MGSKWMVDCFGEAGEGSEQAFAKVSADSNFADFIEKQGSLAVAVQNAITSKGFVVSDRGGSQTGTWHVGVPFDSLDAAVAYLDYMTTKFSKAINMGLLRFRLHTWSQSSW